MPETRLENAPGTTPQAGDGVQATQAADGVQATQAADGVQATQAADGVQATQAADGVQATQAATPAAKKTPRRKTRVMVAVAGIGVAALLAGLGTVMSSNANFSKDYVARQLSEQRITFKAAETLSPAEKATPCLVKYAGQPLTTGKQAECYANSFIGVHLKSVADGKTFSELRGVQTALRTQVTEAQAKGDPSVGDLQRQLNELTAKRQTLFEGESMRGLLLTSFGFDTLGAKAGQASTVAYGAAAGVLVLSLALLTWTVARRRTA